MFSSEKKALLLEALSYIGHFAGKIVVVKYGGAVQENPALSEGFVDDIVLLHSLGMKPVIVHGGGPEVSKMMHALNIDSQFVNGLRVTTEAGLEVAEMILSGKVNKALVALFQARGGKAVGLSGKDGEPILRAQQLVASDGSNLGLVGEIIEVKTGLIHTLLEQGFIPVISPIAMGMAGATYNTNADSAASRIASALQAEKIVFMTDVNGVMKDKVLISRLTAAEAQQLIKDRVIEGGMAPKVEAALHCLQHGVRSIQIINGTEPHAIVAELFTDHGVGTLIVS